MDALTVDEDEERLRVEHVASEDGVEGAEVSEEELVRDGSPLSGRDRTERKQNR